MRRGAPDRAEHDREAGAAQAEAEQHPAGEQLLALPAEGHGQEAAGIEQAAERGDAARAVAVGERAGERRA